MKANFISKEERQRCKKVAAAFEEKCKICGDMAVADAGAYGFVRLMHYRDGAFDEAIVFTDSLKLFNELWECWKEDWLLAKYQNTPMSDLDYDEMYEILSQEEKILMENERQELWRRSFC